MTSTQPTYFSLADGSPPDASLTVFKDASGRYRWLACSSTSFRDRDGEIVSTKALEADVARTDAGGDLGPLRFWHVPGLDIGDCDYSAMSGRTLIESGTFRDERYGQAIKNSSTAWGMSLGFLHPLTEPDANHIYHSIQRFERSILPAGKASNLFTRLVVKEVQVLTPEKAAALKALVNDDSLLAQMLANVQQTEKAADMAGVAFKDTPAAPPVDTPSPAPAQQPVSLDINALAAAISAAVLAPIQGMVSTLTAQTATKDAQAADQAAMVATLKAKLDATEAQQATLAAQYTTLKGQLDTLLGDQPVATGYVASQAPDNILPATHALKNAQPQAVDFRQFFDIGQ